MRRKVLVARARIITPSFESDLNGAKEDTSFERTVHGKPGESHEDDCDEDPCCRKIWILGKQEAGKNMNLLKADTCIECHKDDGQVLVCHEMGCPVSLHKLCMNGEPDFDEAGNFYCPYCWYKNLALRLGKLKEKAAVAEKTTGAENASVAKKAMVAEKGMAVAVAVTVEKTRKEAEHVVEVNSSFEKTTNPNHCENRRDDGESRKQRERVENEQGKKTCVPETREFEVCSGGKRIQSNDSYKVKGSMSEKNAKDQQLEVEEGKDMVQCDVLDDQERMQQTCLEQFDQNGEPQNGFCEYEQLQPNASPSISSPISTDSSSKCDPDTQGFKFVKRPTQLAQEIAEEAPPCNVGPSKTSSRPGSSLLGNRRNQKTNANADKSPTKRKNSTYCDGKRKRITWTPEEEAMLRVGVQKFSAIAVKNMPWRKILDFGQHVFHEERTPIDLKDKWKNMNKAMQEMRTGKFHL